MPGISKEEESRILALRQEEMCIDIRTALTPDEFRQSQSDYDVFKQSWSRAGAQTSRDLVRWFKEDLKQHFPDVFRLAMNCQAMRRKKEREEEVIRREKEERKHQCIKAIRRNRLKAKRRAAGQESSSSSEGELPWVTLRSRSRTPPVQLSPDSLSDKPLEELPVEEMIE